MFREETMKAKKWFMIAAAAGLILAAGVPAQAEDQTAGQATAQAQAQPQAQADKAVVPLSNPAKPAKIEASIIRGSITVKGYDGKDVVVEASVREKSLTEPETALAGALMGYRRGRSATGRVIVAPNVSGLVAQAEPKKERSHEGMKVISAALTGLSVEEKDNDVTISTDSWKYAIDMTIQVPVASSLELGTMNEGNIVVENVNGDLELNGGSGSITLRNVSGNVVAHTLNGDIEAVLNRLTPDKPLSFSTMNGDIDVTLPPSVKATVKMSSQQGNIYSDFDVTLKAAPQKVEESGKADKGRYRIAFDKAIYGAINGGGQEISFTTFTGDIFIRKGK
jgi:hypothetical protein